MSACVDVKALTIMCLEDVLKIRLVFWTKERDYNRH
jgi:hypothetical protein